MGADGGAQTSLSDDPTKGPGRHVLSSVSKLQSSPCALGRAHVSPQHPPWLWTSLYPQKWPSRALSQANPLFRSLLITRQPNSEGPARAGAAGTEATVTSSACLEMSGYGRGVEGGARARLQSLLSVQDLGFCCPFQPRLPPRSPVSRSSRCQLPRHHCWPGSAAPCQLDLGHHQDDGIYTVGTSAQSPTSCCSSGEAGFPSCCWSSSVSPARVSCHF